MTGLEIFDFEQGSPEWFECRRGIPTSSEFSTVMARGKDGGASVTRARYMRKLAGELVTGEPAPEGYTNVHMERGKVQEDDARRLYAFLCDVEPIRVGFVRNGMKGCSPDSLIGERSGLEIKSAIPEVQIERLLRDTVPPEHKAQVQGNIWLTERDTWDFMSYCPKLPPLIKAEPRDDVYIKRLSDEVDRFNDELLALVERIRGYGQDNSHILKNQLVQSVMGG